MSLENMVIPVLPCGVRYVVVAAAVVDSLLLVDCGVCLVAAITAAATTIAASTIAQPKIPVSN